ncbi:MAG: hypothetical protein ACXWDN_04065 [Limisphaerales bacterium]|jgi:hypothetical protein
MKTNISAVKLLSMTALVCAAVLAGCADYASVGVGYTNAYYVPDYTPFYAEYYYDGLPYWGPNITYIRKKVVVEDVDKHVNVSRNIYYGGHHFMGAGNWHGLRPAVRAGGFRRAPVITRPIRR